MDLVDRIPILGRLISEFVRIEFIDRCMLIAAQGLLALIPMLVVLAAFLPHLTGDAVHVLHRTPPASGQDGDTADRGRGLQRPGAGPDRAGRAG